jgi:hypothetical protein
MRIAVCFLMFITFAACSESGAGTGPGGSGPDSSVSDLGPSDVTDADDVARDVVVEDSARPVLCSPFERNCNGVCTDVGVDRTNCGGCGRACPSGQVCFAGNCQARCPTGQVLCGDRCVDPNLDPRHCGGCDQRCAENQVCNRGMCAATCDGAGDGITECRVVEGERYCADTRNDRRNCGACGTLCPLGQTCFMGSCQTACAPEQERCGMTCVDVRTDPSNCGACANLCSSGQVCSGGMCSLQCAAPLVACGDAVTRRCVDPTVDPANCGMCGRACESGEVCRAGACTITCPTGFTICPAPMSGGRPSCADLQADARNCGTCGDACPAGQSCVDGTCRLVCASGQIACEGQCRDPRSDNAHCGACGNACPTGQACVMGRCIITCPGAQAACDMTCRDLDTDLAHCGACGTACPRPANASAACAMGRCTSACNAGFADCDMSAANGCETDVRATVAHCGRCGNACATPNATPACNNGDCAIGRCDTGRGDCDMNADNGCETDTQTSVTHCGGCGRACNLPNAGSACAAGVCAITTCNTGFADCDMSAANGCEVNTASDNVNCGMCGRRCAAGQICAAGACTFNCPTGQTACSDGCFTLASSTQHCGRCENPCPARANATITCAAGACGFQCLAGFADCDMNAANGCETDTRTSAAHCGMCGRACSFANATATCAGGTCGLGACTMGFADCDMSAANGCETNLNTSVTACGMCGRACSIANGTAACAMGQCAVAACNTGFADCDMNPTNGCETDTRASGTHCGMCGRACPAGQACQSGACNVLGSCRELLMAVPTLPNGAYSIDPDGAGAGAPFQVYCDMAGGGWTMILMAGTDMNGQLGYNAPYWTSAALLNPAVTNPAQNNSMKNQAFNALAFTSIRFCLGTITSCVEETITSTSALALFMRAETARNRPVADFAPWGYRGGYGCNRNGFNVVDIGGGPTRYRYGILLNNESACEGSVDGGRGFGGRGFYNTEISAGQGDGIVTTSHERGWVFVR